MNKHSPKLSRIFWRFYLLQCRGPGTDPFRARGPKWGLKWPKIGNWPHPGKWGKSGRENGPKNMEFRPIFPFSAPLFPHSWVRLNSKIFGHFRPHFGPPARNGFVPSPRDCNLFVYFFYTRENGPRKTHKQPFDPCSALGQSHQNLCMSRGLLFPDLGLPFWATAYRRA